MLNLLLCAPDAVTPNDEPVMKLWDLFSQQVSQTAASCADGGGGVYYCGNGDYVIAASIDFLLYFLYIIGIKGAAALTQPTE